jgi:hypothetical protein
MRDTETDQNMGSTGLVSWALLGVTLLFVAGNLQVRDIKVAWMFEVMFGTA